MTGEAIGIPTDVQIKAAKKLFKLIPKIKRNEDILEELTERDPDLTDFHETLLKALAVNDFYSARCPDVYSVARWITDHKIMQRSRGDDDARIALVKDIATCVNKENDGWPVVASKFAHFFIDPEVDFIQSLDKRRKAE